MSQAKAAFIKIPTGPDGFQTYPTDPARRLADSDISIEPCVPSDAEKIAEGLYLAFPESWWDQKEPPALRPPQPIRIQRMATRLLPSLTHPHMKWIKAVLTHTHETIGIAGWMAPSNHPSVHNIFRRSAAEHYGWRERMGWSEAAVEEMWRHTDDEEWSVRFARDDETRRDVMGGERHWGGEEVVGVGYGAGGSDGAGDAVVFGECAVGEGCVFALWVCARGGV
ncbi:hypothetical protein LEMA_P116320.1 [Plenodomus lingam JN3]|uniref:N-acetyltransferase domain-containing protein n=1 Tax=Leptosphaeria maculans (strain JN3 / isolate v23.1.3 / race Av1-4-5-6-7-8) TaxID=985895 RepID=E4ZTR9_LEPMJ|nr:hypothetical protein LEMA_P116320.1 [Plenodomus lingam JN3]CBX94629.1 hypothetical protein LEMA_P116320.1 [Plenodomus lingam JN3]